ALRRDTPGIWRGPRRTVLLDDAAGLYGYVCGAPGDEHLVALNNGPAAVAVALPEGAWALALATGEADLAGGRLTLPAYSGAVLRGA
ncbi:MAG TPA: DUF3459 domain-containing protein, partial [Chloroflexaceae bacterium]|nr:DUF3459 domain-containing protein [Chloroflexaceae bacterium]